MIYIYTSLISKTTQIPQFIHEQNQELKILICQPRRLAAVGVASRVAEEQACSIGDRVGYMVKGDSKVSVNTRIMFCTYGVLLRRLQVYFLKGGSFVFSE